MTTYAVEVGEKPNPNGEHPVRVRVTMKRKHKRFPVGVSVPPSVFRKGRVMPTHPQSETFNKLIRAKLLEVESLVDNNAVKCIEDLIRLMEGVPEPAVESTPEEMSEPTLVAALMDAFNESEQAGKPQTANVFRTVANSVERIIGDLHLDAINYDTLHGYANGLRGEGKRKNTIHKHMRTLRRSINRFIDIERWKGQNPFNRFKYKLSSERTAKTKLTPAEIRLLVEAVLSIRSYDLARDLFLFSFYTCGTRIGDVITLQMHNICDGVLTYSMDKTGDPHEVPLNAAALAIIDKWRRDDNPFIFPLLKENFFAGTERQKKQLVNSAASYVNKYLRLICGNLGITKRVSAHVARHSWAFIAHQSGVSLEDIRKALGHKSILTTQTYISDLSRKVDRVVVDAVTNVTNQFATQTWVDANEAGGIDVSNRTPERGGPKRVSKHIVELVGGDVSAGGL